MLCGNCSADFVQDMEGMVEVSPQVDLILLKEDLLIVTATKCYMQQLAGMVSPVYDLLIKIVDHVHANEIMLHVCLMSHVYSFLVSKILHLILVKRPRREVSKILNCLLF